VTDLLPEALKRVAALDADLAAELQRDLGRLVQAARAVTWAQEQLPRLVRAGSPGAVLQVLVDRARDVTGAPGAWALRYTGDLSGRASRRWRSPGTPTRPSRCRRRTPSRAPSWAR